MHSIRSVVLWVVGAALLLPVAFILTILSFPFWRWIDVTFEIEAFGHSGPAEWCYWIVYVTCLVVALAILGLRRTRRKEAETSA